MEQIAGISEELKKVSYYRASQRILNWAGAISIICGVLSLYRDIGSGGKHPLHIISILIGCLLLVSGVWILITKKIVGLIVFGLMLLIIALWNLGISFYEMQGDAVSISSFLYFGLGIVQIVWSIQMFLRYRQLKKAFLQPPSEKTITMVDEIISSIQKAKPEESADIIEFRSKGFTTDQTWRGKLGAETALFITVRDAEPLFLHKNEVNIEKKGKVILGKTLTVSARLGDQKFKNSFMAPEHLERYETWKSGTVIPQPA